MYRGIHKIRTVRGERGLFKSVLQLFQWRHCFAKGRIKGRAGVKNLTYFPLGKFTSRKSPSDVLRISRYGPICNAKGRILSGTSLGRTHDVSLTRIHKMDFLFFLISTRYQTMHCQSKLKIWYVLFRSYYGLGRFDLNATSVRRLWMALM